MDGRRLGSPARALTGGYIDVGVDLRATNDAFIFAAGDCDYLALAPRSKAGIFAVRQAPVLFDNLGAALVEDRLLKVYRPQKDYPDG